MFANPRDSARANLSISSFFRQLAGDESAAVFAPPPALQLTIPLGVDLLLTPGEHVFRSDVAGGAMQPDV